MKVLLFHLARHHDIVVVLICDKQKLFDESRRRRETDELQNGFEAIVNLHLEIFMSVLDD